MRGSSSIRFPLLSGPLSRGEGGAPPMPRLDSGFRRNDGKGELAPSPIRPPLQGERVGAPPMPRLDSGFRRNDGKGEPAPSPIRPPLLGERAGVRGHAGLAPGSMGCVALEGSGWGRSPHAPT